VLVQVKNKSERSLPVRPPVVEKTRSPDSRDRGQVRAAWWQERQDKVMDGVSWLSLKTKVEPRLRGSRVMSGDWRRLHRVRRVSSGSLENHKVPWLIHKAKTEEPNTKMQRHQTGLTGGSDRSDQCATMQSGDYEAEDTRRDRTACVEAKQVCGRWASIRWCEDKYFQIRC
jgi:hypothetical protein